MGRTITLTIDRNFDYVHVTYEVDFPGGLTPPNANYWVAVPTATENPTFFADFELLAAFYC
jgi:hypothetical protein